MSIIVNKKISDKDVKNLTGDFLDYNYYDQIINENCDVFTLNEENKPKLLFSLRKNVIPKDLSQQVYNSYIDVAKKSYTNSRGICSGIADINKIKGNIVGIADEGKFKTRVIFSNGTVSKYKVSNSVRSVIAGYYDRKSWCKASYDKKNVRSNEELFNGGRETSFVQKNRQKWNNSIPYIQYVNELFKNIYPQQYLKQKETIGNNPFTISDTIFSTITINYNFRCAIHLDNNDLRDGYSVLTVCQKGIWEGHYLGFPQYGICANVKEGDILIMDPHEYHGNTNLTMKSDDYERLSMVFYFREGFLKNSTYI